MKKKEKTRRVLAFMLAVAMIFTTAFTNISASSGFGTPEGTEAAAGLFGDGSKGDAAGAIDAGNLFGDGEAITGSESTKTVTLSGSVTYIAEDQTSHALTNILVRVYTADTEARTVAAEILSNEEGKFRIENLSAGSYTLEYIDKNENFDPAQFTLNQAAEDAGYTVKGVPADKEVEYFAVIENVSVQESREINLSLTQNAQITVDEENSGLVEMEVTEEPDETTEDKTEETTEETGDEASSDSAEETGDETASDSTEETGSEENAETPADESEEGEKTETPAETTPETPAASKIIEVITDEVNLRTTPSVEEENIFAMVNTGAAFEVVEEVTAEDGLWYKVVYEGTEVYIRSDLVQVKETAETPSEETPEETPAEETEEEKQEESEENKEETSEETPAEEKMIELTADEVNIRTAPSAEAEIITVLPIGTRFVLLEEITAEDGTIWYKVRYEDGEAYVSGDMAALVIEEPIDEIEVNGDDNQETPTAETIRIIAEEANLYEQPSKEASILATVAIDTQFEILDKVENEEGLWYKVTYEETEVYVSSEDAELVEQPAVITRYNYQSDEVSVIVTLTDPADLPDNAELVVTPVTISEEAQSQIEEDAIKEQKAIENIVAYDIKFVVDGEEVQPGATVKVQVSIPEVEAGQEATVYHVDEEDIVENMGGSVDEEGTVEFETPHFSTYVIVQQGTKMVTVTLQHYDVDTNEAIYADETKTLSVGSSIPDYRATLNYEVNKVVEVAADGTETEIENYNEIKVASDKTIKIYYKAQTVTTQGDVTFYDYQINPSSGKGINDKSHYSSDYDNKHRMTMGTTDYSGVKYNAKNKNITNIYGITQDLNANVCNYRRDTKGYGTLGLVKGLSEDYSTVEWNIGQPGFFTNDNEGEGKDIFTSYKLNFNRTGNQYELTSVSLDGKVTTTSGSNFFPIKNPKSDGTSDAKYYFGMRYDVEFILGDYVGPLNYEFTGDDDLWVLLDGKVVIDVGGIHDAISKSTNLWNDLGYTNGARPTTDEEKNKIHRITVLYMERGAGASNCQMNFTIPDARFISVEQGTVADITINKTTSDGTPLAGAKFRLTNDGDASESYPVMTSSNDGTVTFTDLKAGTYTLTETMAPNGYVASTETWKVKVTTDSEGNISAKLYKADGTTEVVNNQIINYSEKEEAVKNLTNSKTATVVDEDRREFNIDLRAKTTGRDQGVAAKAASIVLVLDASTSMSDSEVFDDLQSSVVGDAEKGTQGFIDKIRAASPESEIAIVWYNGNETSNSPQTSTKGFLKLNSEKNISELKSFVTEKKVEQNQGTPMGDAMEAAYSLIKSSSAGNERYVVLFTDGMPGYWDESYDWYGNSRRMNCMVANHAVNYAENIKNTTDGNAVIYTVGYALADSSFHWRRGDKASSYSSDKHICESTDTYIQSATGFLEDYIATTATADSQYAYTADTMADIYKVFDQLAGKLGELFSVQAKEIVDVIDSRFELTTESENALIAAYGENISIVRNDDGTTTITWTGEAAKIKNSEEGGWHVSFKVKAKDDFIGGNMVPTNGAASGIYLDGGGEKPFPQPSVNVKLLSLDITDKVITVYKGDTINPIEFANELAGTLKIIELVGDPKYTTLTGIVPKNEEGNVIFPNLTDEQKIALVNNGTITLGSNQEYKYIYPKTNDAVGYFTYTYKKAVNTDEWTNAADMAKHQAMTVGNGVEVYELTVEFIPYTPSEREIDTNILEPTEKGGTELNSTTDKLSATGTYTVNVIAGEIQITKKLDKTATEDKRFSFVVKKVTVSGEGDEQTTAEEEIATVNITVKAGAQEAFYTVAEGAPNPLNGLVRGTYVVSEVLQTGYDVENCIVGDDTNCEHSNDNDTDTVTFVMGNNTSGANVISAEKQYIGGGVLGTVVYTNEEAFSNWQIVKVSSSNSTSGNGKLTLPNAEFTLTDTTNSTKVYKGVSNENGIVAWTLNDKTVSKLSKGTYTLVETKAPTGYALSTESWTVEITKNGSLKSVTSNSTDNPESMTDTNGVVSFYYKNTPVYDLPSSGGKGIFSYLIGGVLLMMAAALIIYKNKCREVLRG